MIKIGARSMKVAATLAIGFLFAGVGTAAFATTTRVDPPPTDTPQVCTGLTTGKQDVVGDKDEITYTAPEGQLIIGYCVKAGSENQEDGGPEYFDVSPGVTSITFGHSTGKDVSHWSVKLSQAPEEPVEVSMNLTYMTACAPDDTNTWRIRNSSGMPVAYTLEYAGQGVVASGTAAAESDAFVDLPRTTATAILKWGGGDTGIVAGSKTKASGNDESCPIEITGVSVTVVDPPLCGPNNDPIYFDIPEGTEGLSFSDTDWVDGKRIIKAIVEKGYILDGELSWEFTDEATDCPVTAVPPTVVPICGPDNDTLTLPEVEGVTYTSSGWVDGELTVKATADEGFVIDGFVIDEVLIDREMSWTFTDVPVASCPDEVGFSFTPKTELAYTGASSGTNGLTALAIFLMSAGTALVALKTRAAR